MGGLETRRTGILCPGGDESLTSMTADRQQKRGGFYHLPAHVGSASARGGGGGGGEANPLGDISPTAQSSRGREHLFHLLIFHAFFFPAFNHK